MADRGMVTPDKKRLVRELLTQPLKAQKGRLVGIVAALAILALSQALFLLMVKGFVKALFQEPGRAAVPLISLLPDKVAVHFPAWHSVMLSRAMLGVSVPLVIAFAGLAKAMASYLYQLNQQAVALHLARRYRERLFEALLALPYIEIRRRPAGEWMSIIMNDVMLLQNRFTDVTTALVKDSVAVVSCFAVLLIVHWPTAVVILVLAPFVAFGLGRTGKRIARYAEAYQRELGRIAGAVLDIRSRFDFIRAQRGEERERERFSALNSAYYRMIRRSLYIRSASGPVLEFVGFAVFAMFVYAIGAGVWGKAFTPELMMQFFVALGLLLKPLREMGEQLARFHETWGTLENSLDVMGRMQDLAAAGHNQSALDAKRSGGSALPDAAVGFGGLAVARMTAGLGGETRFAATDVQIPPGRSIAIVGPSGAGKSTFIKALAGLVKPFTWEAEVAWEEASGLVSMVSQEPFLFDDSIEANLVYGLPVGERPSTAAIWQALATVNIEREVRALPEGLATRLRAIGSSNVSGGQLQRLVIARGLLRGKPIWLLDEATSAVDARSERDITLRLVKACREEGTALVAVTHRLTWLEAYDEVWFIENGQRVFVGAHAALLAEARYREYCASAGGGLAADGAG